MDINTALNLIDQVCSRFSGTREDHANLIKAIEVIRAQTQDAGKEEVASPEQSFAPQ